MGLVDLGEGIVQVFIGVPVFIVQPQLVDDVLPHDDAGGTHCFLLGRDAVEDAVDLAAVGLFFADRLDDAGTVFIQEVDAVPVQQVQHQVLGDIGGSLGRKGRDDVQLFAAGQHQADPVGPVAEAQLDAVEGHVQLFHRQLVDRVHNLLVVGLVGGAGVAHRDLVGLIRAAGGGGFRTGFGSRRAPGGFGGSGGGFPAAAAGDERARGKGSG